MSPLQIYLGSKFYVQNAYDDLLICLPNSVIFIISEK